jgi:hypothetical protein
MHCDTGQVDLNHATAAQLRTLPTPDGSKLSASAAANIIDARPYLQPTDLRAPAVNGVTDNHVAIWIIRHLVCVTPVFVTAADSTQVPVAPDICSTASQADLNDATQRGRFVTLFGGPTADRLVAGMPYPSIDNALRRAGVGPGGLKKYAGKLCVTPYPIRFAGVDWAFATPEDGIADTTPGDFGSYTLTVPAGTTDGNGAWASVEEVPSPLAADAGIDYFTLDLPAVDAHIHGGWHGPVGVTGPPDPSDLGGGYVDTVFHYSDVTGPMMYANDGIAVGDDGRLTVATTDLSVLTWFKTTAKWVAGVVQAALTHAEAVLRASLGVGGAGPTCNPDYTDGHIPDGGQMDVLSDMFGTGIDFLPRLGHCITDAVAANVAPEVKFTDNRGIVYVVTNHSSTKIDDVAPSGGLLWSSLGSAYNAMASNSSLPVLLGPGAEMDAHPKSYVGSYKISTDQLTNLAATGLYWALDEIGALIPEPVIALFVNKSECGVRLLSSVLDGLSPGADVLEAIFKNTSALFDCIVTSLDANPPTMFTDWLGNFGDTGILLDRLKHAVAVLKVAKYSIVAKDFLDQTQAGLTGVVLMKWKPPTPPDPTTDDKGRPVLHQCVTKTFSYDTGWTVTVSMVCQDLAYGDFSTIGGGSQPPCDPNATPQNAWNGWNGQIRSCRLYNVLLRNGVGVLHFVTLDDGELVAHPIAAGDEPAFKQDWPEAEWRSAEFDSMVDRIGSPAVNDPLVLRPFLEGRGGNWLLRQSDGRAWYIDGNGVRYDLGHDAASQEAIARLVTSDGGIGVLTFDPAQYASDICPYRVTGSTGITVC